MQIFKCFLCKHFFDSPQTVVGTCRLNGNTIARYFCEDACSDYEAGIEFEGCTEETNLAECGR